MSAVDVTGNATAEELAAVLVALGRATRNTDVTSPYARWRAQRTSLLLGKKHEG